jgi:hypothetical protein
VVRAAAMDVKPAPPAAAQCEQEHDAAAVAEAGAVAGRNNMDQEAAEMVLDGRIL